MHTSSFRFMVHFVLCGALFGCSGGSPAGIPAAPGAPVAAPAAPTSAEMRAMVQEMQQAGVIPGGSAATPQAPVAVAQAPIPAAAPAAQQQPVQQRPAEQQPQAGGGQAAGGGVGGAGGAGNRMSFFVTSRTVEVNGQPVNGGNLGGLAGTDAFCTLLARAVDANDNRTWRAYLSTTTENARDRIGTGPWYNAAGQLIANNVNELHATPPASANILTEQREGALAGGGRHDILTGSQADGTRFPNGQTLFPLFTFPDGSFTYTNQVFDYSCNNWTENGTASEAPATIDNYAIVGHVDWNNLQGRSASWNSSHATACDIQNMNQDQGTARLYCFAQ